MKSPFDRARNIYNRYQFDDDISALDSCLAELNELLPEDDSEGEVNYIYGLLLYNRECLAKGDTDKALAFFRESKRLNPSHYMSSLYSGHCHHDKKRYPEALKEYESVDIEMLKEDYPIWRYVKLQEQKGECLHRMGRKEDAMCYFEEVSGHYENIDSEELVLPTELLRTLDPSHPISIKLENWS
ncbi:tetratricopeptide repeat protein [Coraliomargarita akajimensis]|uniref:tetratricopeptide repeat protein n=1 Tax=Coraliomargarita akajimensis TaxID=395922 RepID=UPI00059F40F9|nr:hypothetical protein [Coraliomargarita akajimensis]